MFSFRRMDKTIAAALLTVFVLVGCGGAEERKAKYLERAIAFFEEENFDKARIEFKNVLQIDPKTAAPYYYMGRIAEKDQEWRQAFGNYSKAVELDPEMIEARVRLGRFHVLGGQLEQAEEQAAEVLAREPDNPEALTLRATVLYRTGKADEAIAIIDKVLSAAPGNEGAALLMAGIYEREERPAEAVGVLEAATAANTESVSLQLRLIQAYLKQQDNDKAETMMKALIDSHPDVLQYRVTLASFYAQTNQDDRALAVLNEAIAADPDDAQRYLLRADFYKNKQGLEQAIAQLEQDVAAKPEFNELKFALAQSLLQTEQIDKAEAIYSELIDSEGTAPDGLKARMAIAAIRASQDRKDEAKALIEEVLAENAKDTSALLLKGRLALADKDYADAITSFRSVLKDQPDSAEVMTLLAAAHEANGETELAEENLRRAVDVQPNDVQARLRLAAYIGRRGDLEGAMEHIDAALAVEPASVQALRARAEILARQGDTEALEETLTKLEQASPETGLGSFGKGRLYKSQQKFPEALAAFEEAFKKEPDSVLVLTELVNTEIAMGNPDAAIERLTTVLADDPDNRIAHDLLGIAYMAKEDYTSAEQSFLNQLKVNQQSSVVYAQLAAARARQGNLDAAVQTFRDGLVQLPNNQQLLLGLAGLHVSQGALDEAVAVYEEGSQAEPDNLRYPLGIATIRERQQRYEDAISIYENLIEKNPDNLVIINNLAALLSDHREDNQSLQRARDLAGKLAGSEQPALLDTLGWVHYRLGEYDDAARVLSDVVAKAPDVPVFNYHLGMTYYKQGDMRAAKEILARAVGDDVSYPGVDEARAALAEINKE